MIYDVRHTASYAYGSVVPYSRHVARMLPVDRPGQRVATAALTITPEPSERSVVTDFFGNRITTFALSTPHDRLTVELTARISVAAPEPLLPGFTDPHEHVAAAAAAVLDLGPRSPAHHLYPTRRIPLDPALTAYAAESFLPARPVLEAAVDLMRRINSDFVYEPGATDVETLPAAAFEARRGVCQDFAHVMIAAMRGIGLPAAYVSGYLRNEPAPGQPRLEGADATHAWVEVWCGPLTGWIGLDPTNAMAAGEDHIVTAVGRDYADVSPVDGVIVATGGHALTVSVDVKPVVSGRPPAGRADGAFHGA